MIKFVCRERTSLLIILFSKINRWNIAQDKHKVNEQQNSWFNGTAEGLRPHSWVQKTARLDLNVIIS